jgi:hypothetical protein
MLVNERLELGDELRVPAEREVGFDALLEGGHPELVEAQDLRLDERLVGEVGKCGAAPEGESVSQKSRRDLRRGVTCSREKALELLQIELVRPDLDHVARFLRSDRLAWGKRLAQTRDVVLERVGGAARRLRSPELVDQPVAGDDLVRTREQHREQGPLPRSPEGDRATSLDDLERSEDPELHASPRTDATTHLPAQPNLSNGSGRDLGAYRLKDLDREGTALSAQRRTVTPRLPAAEGQGDVVYRAYDLGLTRTVPQRCLSLSSALCGTVAVDEVIED